MFKPVLIAALLLVLAAPVRAQDIVGLEDCSKAASPEKKIGCLQSNVAFLHGLIRKNDAAAQAKLREATAKFDAAAAKLDAAAAKIDQLGAEVARLKAALDRLEKKAPAK